MATWLLVHGFTGAPASFDPLCARLEALSRGTKLDIVREALPGHAGRAVDPEDSFEGAVNALVTRIKQLAPPIRVLGYSMGARLVLGALVGLAARPGTRISSATLIGAHFGLETAAARTARVLSDDAWAHMLDAHGLETFLEAWGRQDLFASQAALPPAALEMQAGLRRSHSAAGLAGALRQLGLGRMPNYWPSLSALSLPIRLVVGAHDAKFLALASRALASLPRGDLTVVPGVGHNVLLEAPRELAAILQSDRAGC